MSGNNPPAGERGRTTKILIGLRASPLSRARALAKVVRFMRRPPRVQTRFAISFSFFLSFPSCRIALVSGEDRRRERSAFNSLMTASNERPILARRARRIRLPGHTAVIPYLACKKAAGLAAWPHSEIPTEPNSLARHVWNSAPAPRTPYFIVEGETLRPTTELLIRRPDAHAQSFAIRDRNSPHAPPFNFLSTLGSCDIIIYGLQFALYERGIQWVHEKFIYGLRNL